MGTKSLSILVSGGLGGIGRATAVRLARDGHRICALYNHTPVDKADAFVRSLGPGHVALQCDLTDPQSVARAVAQADAALGGIDVCVHAAVSPLVRQRASTIAPTQFKEQFEVTLFGGLALFQSVIPYFRTQGAGHFIGLTSAALKSETASVMAGYICAKYALHGLLSELRKELAPTIRVDEVAPRFVPTPLHADLPQTVRDFFTERSDAQTPEEVADEIARLIQHDL